MKVEVQELDPCKRQLVVEAPEEEVRAAWTAACGRVQRDARLPGFRRGKVPMTLVRSRFADEVRQAVAEALIPAVYRRAVDEAQLRPVEDPDFRELDLEEGPAPPLHGGRGDQAGDRAGRVSGGGRPSLGPARDGRRRRDDARRRSPSSARPSSPRPAGPRGRLRGGRLRAASGGCRGPRSEQGYAFEVGGGRVLPEMDEAVIGLEAGAERRVQVRFPDQHPREELRGRPGELTLRVVEVKEKEVPPVDDELARGLGMHDTLAELREAVPRALDGRPGAAGSARARGGRGRRRARPARRRRAGQPGRSGDLAPDRARAREPPPPGRRSRTPCGGTTRSSAASSGPMPSAPCAARSSWRPSPSARS